MKEQSEDFEPVTSRDASAHRFELRIWHGAALDVWLGLMRGNWGKVSVARYPLLATITVFAIVTQIKKWLANALFDRRVHCTEISPDPIFVLGHWRSGTTWLHQTLIADPDLAAPDAMACFHPDGFLLGRKAFAPLWKLAVSRKRPMDNVRLTPTTAEEDEIGILLSGGSSPYVDMLFPGEPKNLLPPTRPEDMSADQAETWRTVWLHFLRKVQFVNPGKRLVLKSPLHSLRVSEILRHFPNARFIHIVRDPYLIYASTLKSGRAMDVAHSLQSHRPSLEQKRIRVLNQFVKFHEIFHATKNAIPEGHLMTLRYEDLRADLQGEMRQIYETLEIGDFDAVAHLFGREAQIATGYKTNEYKLDDETISHINTLWDDYFERYGYTKLSDRVDTNV